MVTKASAKVIDLTNVKDGSVFNKRRMPVGDYPARITAVEDKKAESDGGFMWLFTISVDGGGTYPYYCKLVEAQLWKVRNLCLAAGMNVPKKRLKLDPEKLIGKRIAVTLEDEEYEGKKQSQVNATFPLSELDGVNDAEGIGDDSDDDLDDEDEEVAPPPRKKAAKKKVAPPPEPEDDEDELDEEEDDDEVDELAGLDRDKLKRRLRKAVPGVSIKRNQSDDDLRDAIRAAEGDDDEEEVDDEEEEEDEVPPPKKATKKAAVKKRSTRVADVTDDELDELDIDEI